MQTILPRFRVLQDDESRAMLARHRVGRIAFSLHDRVDIEPIHYAFDDPWIFGRTSIGTKLSRLAHHPWCAFEVDEVHGTFDWTSVVVKGSFYLLDPMVNTTTYERALELLRRIIPQTFQKDDPVPNRTVVFGIHADEITGRAASGE